MPTLRKLALLVGLVSLFTVLAVGPSTATEAGTDGATQEAPAEAGEGAHEGEGDGKMQLPLDTSRPRDAVGLVILGLVALGIALAVDNARRQLRGERPQASGKWRYR